MAEINDTILTQVLNATVQANSLAQHSTDSYLLVSIVGIVASSFLYIYLFSGAVGSMISWKTKAVPMIRRYMEKTGRHLIIMNHAQTGFFGSMITMEDAHKIEHMLRRFGNKKVDFIINTFGGDLFASMRIARMMREHPNVRVIVPKYAWSGGTLCALGSHEIQANPTSIFGPVDPQFGTILKAWSAKYWEEIIRQKGSKAQDDTIAMARMGKEIMAEVKSYLKELMRGKRIKTKEFYDLFLEGKHTHGNMISPKQIDEIGIKIEPLKSDLPDRIVEMMSNRSGVFGFANKKMKLEEN